MNSTHENIDPELSIEGILASIRQVIADDMEKKPKKSPENITNEDINDDQLAEKALEVKPEPEPEPEPEPKPKPKPKPKPSNALTKFDQKFDEIEIEILDEDSIDNIEDNIEDSSLSDLNNIIRMGNLDQTIENMARQLLMPMMHEWLDDNLADLAERLVGEEIQKITGISKIEK